MILTDNAPELEYKLHEYFADRRVNKVNRRKEFFEITIGEIQEAIERVYEPPIEFKQIIPEAAEYRETMEIVREEQPAEDRSAVHDAMRARQFSN